MYLFNLADHSLYRKNYTNEEWNNTSLFDRFKESFEAFDYLIDKGYDNWLITFSGGKDSTTVLILAIEYAKKFPNKVKRLDVVYSDTLVEIPTINEFAKSIIRFLKRFTREEYLNIYTHITKPEYNNRFWVKISKFFSKICLISTKYFFFTIPQKFSFFIFFYKTPV